MTKETSEQAYERLLNEARQLAAQSWCDKETQHLTMEPALAEAFAKRLVLPLLELNRLPKISSQKIS